MFENSGFPEISEKESIVLSIIRENWPVSALEIAEHLKEDLSSLELRKRHSTNYTYYLKKLVEKRLVLSKRVGNALVVWPLEAEAYRAIHKIISGDSIV